MRKTNKLLIVISVILLCVFTSCKDGKGLSFFQSQESKERYISVTGEGVAKARPDIATFTVSIEELAPTTEEALNNANAKISKVYETLLKHSIQKSATETSSLRISPRTKWENGQEVFTGQGVTQTIRVRMDVDKDSEDNTIGVLIDDLGLISGITVGSIEFSIKDKEPLYKEAREKAVQNAVLKTKDFAKGAGVEVGEILSITEGSQAGVYARNFASSYAMPADESYVGTSITSGDVEVKVFVNINTNII